MASPIVFIEMIGKEDEKIETEEFFTLTEEQTWRLLDIAFEREQIPSDAIDSMINDHMFAMRLKKGALYLVKKFIEIGLLSQDEIDELRACIELRARASGD